MIEAAVREAFPARFIARQLRDLGTYNCRKKNVVGGSSEWSEHAWGNAWDCGGTPEALDELYTWLLRARRQTTLPIGLILYRVLLHYTHIHVEGRPAQNPDGRQTPPCADGTGDNEMAMIEDIQKALNAAGFKGADGIALAVDGKWGPNTAHAFKAMAKDAASDPAVPDLSQFLRIGSTVVLDPMERLTVKLDKP